MTFFGFYDQWKPTIQCQLFAANINRIVCFRISQKAELSSCMPLMFAIFFKKINLENDKFYNDNLLLWNLPEIAKIMIFKNVCLLPFAMNIMKDCYFS